MKYFTNLDMEQNEIQNALLHPLSSAPENGKAGQIYYNTTENIVYKHDGEKWSPINIKPDWDVPIGDIAEILNKPTKLSQFENDSNFATKDEVNASVGSVVTISFLIVSSLPSIGQSNIVYLVPKDLVGENNIYSEYIWVEDKFEIIGDTNIDLTGYVKSYKETIMFDGTEKTIQHNLNSTNIVVNGLNTENQNIWIEYTVIDLNSITINTGNIGQNINICIIA